MYAYIRARTIHENNCRAITAGQGLQSTDCSSQVTIKDFSKEHSYKTAIKKISFTIKILQYYEKKICINKSKTAPKVFEAKPQRTLANL